MLLRVLIIISILSVSTIAVVKNSFAITPLDAPEGKYEINTTPYKKVGEKFYYFSEEDHSWHSAFLECLSMNGFLASIKSRNEMNELIDYMRANFNYGVWWLSAKFLHKENQFYWYGTGEAFNNTGWFNKEFNYDGREVGVTISKDKGTFAMFDLECKEKVLYICEAEKPATYALTVF